MVQGCICRLKAVSEVSLLAWPLLPAQHDST